VAYSPDGQLFLTVSDKTVRLWDSETAEPLGPRLEHPEAVAFSTFRPDGRVVLTATKDATVRMFDANTGHPLCEPLSHAKPGISPTFAAAAFRGDSRFLATSCSPNGLRLWDAVTGRPLSGFLPPNYAYGLALRPDGKVLAAGNGEELALLYGVPSGRAITAPRNPDSKRALAFSPDGSVLVTGTSYYRSTGPRTSEWVETVRRWDGATGKPLGEPLVHPEGQVQAIAFSRDGKLLVTAAQGTVRVWHVASGMQLGPPIQVEGWSPVKTASFAERGKDGRIVQAEAWSLDNPLGSAPNFISSVAFSPDGTTILVGESYGATLRPVPPRYADELRGVTLWLQVTTGMEMDADGNVRHLAAATWHQRRRELERLGDDPASAPPTP
jgi:WD40 repeat protein